MGEGAALRVPRAHDVRSAVTHGLRGLLREEMGIWPFTPRWELVCGEQAPVLAAKQAS